MKNKLKASETEESPQSDINFLVSGVDIDNRIIEIRSMIDENVASVVIRALMVMATRSSKEPINILLSSGGGSVYDGLAIYDYLFNCPCPIHIQASGLVASTAFIIYLAGDVRTATPNTTFMMHSLSYEMPNRTIVKHHEIEVVEGKRVNAVLQDIMGTRFNRNKEYWYRTVALVDKYFTVQEAEILGILKQPIGKKNVKRKNIGSKLDKRTK